MSGAWVRVKLKDVCRVEKRQGHYKALPYVGLEDIEANTGRFVGSQSPKEVKSSTFRFGANHILYGRLRPYLNKVCITGFEGHCSTEIFPIAANERVLSRFLVHWLMKESTVRAIDETSTGARMPRAQWDEVMEFDFPVPPLAEQKRIVAILDRAFEAIDRAKDNTFRSRHIVRSVFASYLQATFAKLAGNVSERKMGDETVLTIVDGDRGANYPKATDFHDDGYCLFLNTKNVRPDGFRFDSKMFITAEKDAQLRKGKLSRGDVVLTTRGTIGNIGHYTDDIPFENIRINSGMLILRATSSVLRSSFLFELLRSDVFRSQMEKKMTGAAQPQLPIKTLVELTIPIPTNLSDQDAIVGRIGFLEPDIKRLEAIYERKLIALGTLRQAVLRNAFEGNFDSL
jgi:type I restriction enzyme, S subunit